MDQRLDGDTQSRRGRPERSRVRLAPPAVHAGNDGVEPPGVERRPFERSLDQSAHATVREDAHGTALGSGPDGRLDTLARLYGAVERRADRLSDDALVGGHVGRRERGGDVLRERQLPTGLDIDVGPAVPPGPVVGHRHPALAEFASGRVGGVGRSLDGDERPE